MRREPETPGDYDAMERADYDRYHGDDYPDDRPTLDQLNREEYDAGVR